MIFSIYLQFDQKPPVEGLLTADPVFEKFLFVLITLEFLDIVDGSFEY